MQATTEQSALALMRQVQEFQQKAGCSLERAAVIEALVAAGGRVSLSEVRAVVGTSSSSLTHLLDRLVRDGVVDRERDTFDRRRIYVWLV